MTSDPPRPPQTKVLVLAQHFPPVGGAGVQRITKFVKYLPAFGIEPVVVTGSGEPLGRWLPEDTSLTQDLPATLQVFRTSSNGSWPANPARLEEIEETGAKAIEATSPKLIFVTMSPFVDAGPAARLAAKFQIPWVADLRDPWALDEFQTYRHRWERHRERAAMKAALSTAALIIMNTPEAAARVRKQFPSLHNIPVTSITNGFDAEDFPPAPAAADQSFFTIVHSGAFHTDGGLRQKNRHLVWNLLGKVEAGVELLTRSHFYFLQALKEWFRREPAVKDRIKVVFAGVPTDTDRRLVEEAGLAPWIQFTGYVPHTEALEHVRNAGLLFLPMHKLKAGQRATIVPGKLYEYLASRRPVLGAVPEGDARDFLLKSGAAAVTGPDDVPAMVSGMKKYFDQWQQDPHTARQPLGSLEFIQNFDRQQLTGILATHLKEVCRS